jgi:hypothetical protein
MGRASSPLRDRLIFVVGAQRSGTNWIQRVLATHPRVAAAPSETFLFSHGLRPLEERFHHGSLSSSTTGRVYANRDLVLDGMRDLCDAVFGGLIAGLKPSADHLVERTPHHAYHLDLIGEVYPDGRFIHMIRDGRDVVRSLIRQDWGPADAGLAAREWKNAVEAARKSGSALANYHEVRYEELLERRDSAIPKLFSAVGLDAGDADIAQALSESVARFNVDRSDPRVAANKWEKGLDPGTLEVVLDEAGDLLADLGYEVASGEGGAGAAPARSPVLAEAGRSPSLLRARLAGKLREKLPSRTERSAPPTLKVGARLSRSQAVADHFLTLAVKDPRATGDLLLPDAHVRILTDTERYEGRGDPARERLVEAVRSDQAWRGHQAFGYLHPSTTTFTFVARFELEGLQHPRVVTLDIAGDRVRRVAYYAFKATPA